MIIHSLVVKTIRSKMMPKIQYSNKEYFGLGKVPVGIGAVLRGRDLTEEEFRNPNNLPVFDSRFMTEACPLNCIHCFTGKPKRTLTLEQITNLIDELAKYKPKSIELEGEGEPTVDPWFFDIIEYISSKNIIPTVYTEAATKLRDRKFVRHCKEAGATIDVKIDSFYNSNYENWIVGDKTGKYFQQRNEAIDVLMKEGFNEPNPDGTTRLGFLNVISKQNIHEIPDILRFCRDNNIHIAFNRILHTGRVLEKTFDKRLLVIENERQKYWNLIREIDKNEYGFDHPVWENFATQPCVEYMLVHGDGSISLCPGNLEKVGNILQDSIQTLRKRLNMRFPDRGPLYFDGHCPFRPKIYKTS